MTARRLLLTAIPLLALAAGGAAQGSFPLQLSIAVPPPYSPSLYTYFSTSSNIVLTVTNTSSEPRSIYLAGGISSLPFGDISAVVDGANAWGAPPLEIPANAAGLQFTGSDLEPILQAIGSNPATLTGIDEQQLLLGTIPEGEYRICIRAYDYFDPGTALSPDDGTSCAFIQVRESEPPEPITPTCLSDGTGELVTPQTPQFVNFNWILPGGGPTGVQVYYDFILVRIESPTNAEAALETSTDVVYMENDIPVNALQYTQAMPALEEGHMYAWRVRAHSIPDDLALFRNQGKMRPCTFTYAAHASTGFSLSFPLPHDTLPWDLMPLMGRFEPHAGPLDANTTGSFWSRLKTFKDAQLLCTTYRQAENDEINWNSGYFLTQHYLLGSPPEFTEDQARNINLYTNTPTADQLFQRGSLYTLTADLRIKDMNGGDPRYGDIEGAFVRGMGRPRPISPAADAVLPSNGGDTTVTGFAPVSLRFLTAEPPLQLRPPFPISMIYGSNAPSQTEGSAHERWKLEVSRSMDMAAPILTASEELGPVDLLDAGCDDNCVSAMFYKEDSVLFTPADTGTYYWRLSWLRDPDNADGPTYHEGPVRMFRVAEADTSTQALATGGQQQTEERPRECVSVCKAAPTPLEKRIPTMNINAGDTVQVGLFQMSITTINWAGGFASGEGVIPVPFMYSLLRVRFQNVQINADKTLYHGDVYGIYDNEDVVPVAWRMGMSATGGSGLTPTETQLVDDFLSATGRLITQADGSIPMGLPIGIATDAPGFPRITVGIVGMQFNDTVARLNGMMNMSLPELGLNIGLGSSDQVFQPDGVGCPDADALLYLASDFRMPVGGDTLVMKGMEFAADNYTVLDSGTFAAWDCRGFRALQIDAEWRFDREGLTEDLPDGSAGQAQIVAALKMRTGRGGLLGRVDFNKPFQVAGAEGWGFDVQEAWIDMAGYTNPPGMVFPPDVAMSLGGPGGGGRDAGPSTPGLVSIDNLWRGFYLKRAMLRLPQEVKRFGSTERVTALVENMAIANAQVTGSIKLANLIGENEADLDGWAFSVDTLQLDIVSNSFRQAGLKGRMRTAISPALLEYAAMWRQRPYTSDKVIEFLIQPQEDLDVPFLFSTIELDETSNVTATLGHSAYGNSAKATLHGRINVTPPPGLPVTLNFTGIKFQDLWFGTRAPYTNIDSSAVFSLASPQKWMGGTAIEDVGAPPPPGGAAGGFPVSITQVKGERRTIDGKPAAGIAYDINLKLTGSTNIFQATTRVATMGTLSTGGPQSWGDPQMQLDSIGVTGGTGGVQVEGGLNWYRDSPTFGNGIKGRINARFMNGKVDVKANAQFGTVGTNKYWYVDAMAARAGGFNRPSAFTIYGFGGAAWYHMRQTGTAPGAAMIASQELANLGNASFEPGISQTGLGFVPDPGVDLGFKATLIFGDPSSGNAYNGDVSAGAQFSTSGGVQNIFLDGNLFLMHKRGTTGHVPARGTGRINYDFPNDAFSALFDVYVNVGPDRIVGTGPNKKAGQLDLFIGPDDWHLYVGRTDQRVGLTFRDLFSGNFYLMLGDGIPGVPPPPQQLAGLVPASYLQRPDISDASGIAFGANVPFSKKGDLKVFRYALNGDIGFDLVFRDSEGMACEGIPEPGIGPFYANGQLYGLINAAVSLDVNLRFFSGQYNLFNASLAGMFNCGFANPSWANGVVSGSYSILHGAVSGSTSLPFTIGDQCVPPDGDGPLAGIDPIGGLVPEHLSGMPPGCNDPAVCGVDCGAEPEAVFNQRIDEPFTINEQRPDGSLLPRTYRLRLDILKLSKANGDAVACAPPVFNTARDRVSLRPSAYLAPLTEYACTLRVVAERLDNNVWMAALDEDGQPVTWQRINRFQTNTGIDELRPEDVERSYPFHRQRYVLQDECRKGIIICKADMSAQPVFKAPPGKRRVFTAVFTPITGGASISRAAEVLHGMSSRISFPIPELLNSTTYGLRIVARDEFDPASMVATMEEPAGGGAGTTGGAGVQIATPLTTGTAAAGVSTSTIAGGMVVVRRQTISGYTLRDDEKLTYLYHFRTSAFNTLAAKAAGLTHVNTARNTLATTPVQETLDPSFSGERFDTYDLMGFTYGPQGTYKQRPLVGFRDAGTDTWMLNWAKPLIYDYYNVVKASGCSDLQLDRHRTTQLVGLFQRTIISDTPDTIGRPPVRTVTKHPYYAPDQPLSSSETVPPMIAGQVNGAMVATSGTPTSVPALFRISTGAWVAKDYARMATITADVVSECGPVNPPSSGDDVSIQMPEPLRSKVMAFQASTYRPLYKGNYGIRLDYVPPMECEVFNVETGQQGAGGSTGILQYYHATGSTPPLIGINVGGTGGSPY